MGGRGFGLLPNDRGAMQEEPLSFPFGAGSIGQIAPFWPHAIS
jgi:hypothetical protein